MAIWGVFETHWANLIPEGEPLLTIQWMKAFTTYTLSFYEVHIKPKLAYPRDVKLGCKKVWKKAFSLKFIPRPLDREYRYPTY